MSSGYVVPIDPNDFSRFIAYDPRYDDSFFDSEDDTLSPEELEALEQEISQLTAAESFNASIEPLLDRIPDLEADIIELYYLKGKRQADIATIFGVTQAAISYRLQRGLLRIKFLLELPSVSREQMIETLSKVFPGESVLPSVLEEDPEAHLHVNVRILVNMWEVTCQTAVAKILGLTQGRIRHRFFKAVAKLKKLAETDPELEPYVRIFGSMKFNILREVKLPQWSDRGQNEIL